MAVRTGAILDREASYLLATEIEKAVRWSDAMHDKKRPGFGDLLPTWYQNDKTTLLYQVEGCK
ncbi:hypothetical protein DVH05_008583 [Phytophthora capsici]|nr:hypothetical protein DVH05_008583 [Phytophthora capsici]